MTCMVTEEPTRKILKELREAGFSPIRNRKSGSHTWWQDKSGIGVSVPDGHRKISPGVVRKIRTTIEKAQPSWTGTEPKSPETGAGG
jgi:predicted RNA binding protein YcfA (HicA-like mRNA interferase family)